MHVVVWVYANGLQIKAYDVDLLLLVNVHIISHGLDLYLKRGQELAQDKSAQHYLYGGS